MNINISPTKKRMVHGGGEAMLFSGTTEESIRIVAGVMMLSTFGHPLKLSWVGTMRLEIKSPFLLRLTPIAVELAESPCRLWTGQSACGKRVIAAIAFVNPAAAVDETRLQKAMDNTVKRQAEEVIKEVIKGTGPVGHPPARGFVASMFPKARRG